VKNTRILEPHFPTTDLAITEIYLDNVQVARLTDAITLYQSSCAYVQQSFAKFGMLESRAAIVVPSVGPPSQ
jgi:hypothetical protein